METERESTMRDFVTSHSAENPFWTQDAVMDLSANLLCDCDVPGTGVVSRLWPAEPRKRVSIFRRYNGFFFL